MTRDDLDELHELAHSISAEAKGWRAHRRERVRETVARRTEAEFVAPVKRRRRHRWVAAVAVAVVAISGIVLVVAQHPSPPAKPPAKTAATIRHEPDAVRVGQNAAVWLAAQGESPNLFSCESWYETQRLAGSVGQGGAVWRAGYLAACAQGGTGTSSTG